RPDIRARAHLDDTRTRSLAARRPAARRATRSGRSRDGPLPALFPSPFLDLSMVARQEDLRHAPAAKVGWTRVMGILETAVKLGGEALERSRLLFDRSGKPASDRVDENHCRKISVREDIGPDRDRVGGKMLDDTLVESFEACGQQGEPLLAGALLDDVLGQLPTLRFPRSDDLGGLARV